VPQYGPIIVLATREAGLRNLLVKSDLALIQLRLAEEKKVLEIQLIKGVLVLLLFLVI
jgi:hypothetical protein